MFIQWLQANLSKSSLNEGVELIEIVGEGVVLQLPNHGVSSSGARGHPRPLACCRIM